MRIPGRLPALALALTLIAATPVHAQDGGECPHPRREGWPSPEELQEKLQAHEEWLDNGGLQDPAIPGRAVLCNADLSRADLRSAHLAGADLRNANLEIANLAGAELVWANLAGANLRLADLQSADLSSAQLEGARLPLARLGGAKLALTRFQGADLSMAQLRGADLFRARLQEARLAFVDLTGAVYGPIGLPDSYVEGITGLSTVGVPHDRGELMMSGLVQLRDLLRKAGLRDREREATYAIEYNKTHHALARWQERPLAGLEAVFRLVAFEWPVAYGLHPGRALVILLMSIGGFALVYLIPLSAAGTGGIHQVWPEGRLEARSSTAALVGRAKVERLRPRGWWGLKRLLRALQFSVLSAFHLGWRELNVGNWIARIQAHEYTLRATGWVRVVAGVQSLISVYLLALWALTYFGRPFQ